MERTDDNGIPRQAIWGLVLGGVAITPVLVILAVIEMGGGHGSYFVAQTLFPYTMIWSTRVNEITTGAFILALCQFPVYGLMLAVLLWQQPRRFELSAIVLSAVHLVAAGVALFMGMRSNAF